MTVELSTIYKQIATGNGKQYELLFSIVGMLSSVMEFDPVTDEPLPITVDDVLYGLSSVDAENMDWQNDRLQHIVCFASTAVRNLIDLLHEKNLREHRITRPEQIREVDSRSMMWLAKKPGFTVKQKIASEQRMMGVYHTTSLDTAENRLFKSFMQKLEELLLEKENACRKCGLSMSEDFEHFVSMVHRWLKSDEALLIGKWNNTPPNNTLLNDKNYRKIWKAHLMLQNLNNQVQYDLERIEHLKNAACFWLLAAKMNCYSEVRFLQKVLFPESQTLNLTKKENSLVGFIYSSSWKKLKCTLLESSVDLSIGDVKSSYSLNQEIKELAEIFLFVDKKCGEILSGKKIGSPKNFVDDDKQMVDVAAVDLCTVLPSYSLDNGNVGQFSKKLVCQSQCIEKKWYPYSCARSKLIFTKSKGLKTFSIHSIFDTGLLPVSDSEENKTDIEKACANFAKTIKDELHCKKCLYVTNDDVDDFSPSVNAFKFYMNTAFSNTEILPRSIAILFANLQYVQARFRKEDEVTVRTIFDDYEIKSKIRIDYDKQLAKDNPETKGFVFKRLCVSRENLKKKIPPNIIPQNMEHLLTLQDSNLLKDSFSVDESHFMHKVGIQKNSPAKKEIVFFADNDSSVGAVKYDRLQKITPDIPLWLDVLPKLSMVDSTGKEYVLVEPEKVSIRPVVGKPMDIPISWKFVFPQGKAFYEFPLVQGDNKESSKYFAFIKDSSLPLEHETKCRLKLTYTYGKPLPYDLEFISVKSAEFRSVSVKWENKSRKDYIHDMPVPNFVREYTWEDMACFPKRDSDKTSDFVNSWLFEEYKKIYNSGIYRVKGTTRSNTPNTNVFFLQIKNGIDAICYIDNEYIVNVGSSLVWGYLQRVKKGLQILDPHVIGSRNNKCEFAKSLRFPAIMVWNNGRSVEDADCPESFRKNTELILEKLKELLAEEHTPKCVVYEYKFLLSCMHKDIPDWFYPELSSVLKQIESYFDYPNWIAYALGDCSMEWQIKLLESTMLLLENPKKAEYAIRVLAVALWRVNSFVFNLNSYDVKVILKAIREQFEKMKTQENDKIKNMEKGLLKKTKNQRDMDLNRIRLYSACLECVVALCRLRKKKNDKDAEKNMLSALSPVVNPDVKIIVENMKAIKSKIKTFLTFDIVRPSEDQTPELLYAAHGYLSGLIDSNAIKVLEADFSE